MPHIRNLILLAGSLVLSGAASAWAADAAPAKLDLSAASLVLAPGMTGPEKKAAEMLVDEVGKRSQVRWPQASQGPASGPVVYLGQRAALLGAFPDLAAKLGTGADDGKAEGYHIVTLAPGTVIVAGNDARGVLFGAGRLLRLMDYTGEVAPDHLGTVTVAPGINLSTAPAYALRGHQLGYRPKTNAYDGWSPAMWEQYIRDLVIFGTNAIEGIPPRSDDAADSPHFTLPPQQGLMEQSRLAKEYGIDFWIWYPAMDRDYGDPATVESALKEWEGVLKQLPKLDDVFVPGGDPGHTTPKNLFPFLEKVAAMLNRIHPGAKLWMSPQGFDADWMNDFFDILKTEPTWLEGIVFGPQQRMSLDDLRARVPKRYKMRFYPDITHSIECQYPVPDWDYAYQVTENREVTNPRPTDEAAIFHRLQPLAGYGFLTYSEGCNDDINKFIWSGLGWDPNESTIDILRDYSHYFIGGGALGEGFAQGIMGLERDWRGPLLTNDGVYTTLAQFQDLEKMASPAVLENWRFQAADYRAYYDATDRARLIAETAQEGRAMDQLRRARIIGSEAAMAAAERELAPPAVMPAAAWRARCFELAEALFQSIHAQLSVDRYRAIAIGRGANLDLIDTPLNNAQWLREQFAEIGQDNNEQDRLRKLDAILDWTDPGPGGFYDNLGDMNNHPHLVMGRPYDDDPAFLKGPFIGVGGGPQSENQLARPPRGGRGPQGPRAGGQANAPAAGAPAPGAGAPPAAAPGRGGPFGGFPGPFAVKRISSARFAQTLHEQPLEMEYKGLDKQAHYKLRIVYAVSSARTPIKLVANGTYEVHPAGGNKIQAEPLEFDLPQSVTAGGELRLTWTGPAGLGGDGRGVQVSEVWLEQVLPVVETPGRGNRGGFGGFGGGNGGGRRGGGRRGGAAGGGEGGGGRGGQP
jgi:hypothetical protein